MKEVHTLGDLESWRELAPPDRPPIRLGVFGEPVAHSRSPEMQNAALATCGFDMQYARFEIARDELPRAMELVRELNFVGLNLTIPHKAAGIELVDEVDEFARAVGTINSVRLEQGRLSGFNTDGPGFRAAINSEFETDLAGLRILLFGAGGGAGRAIATQCARGGCERVTLVNRTAAKAQQLAQYLHATSGTLVEAVAWNQRELHAAIAEADLLVNATSVGLLPTDTLLIPADALHAELMVYDTVYASTPTALLWAARNAGARTANGLSMLLHQGALAFETWFGREAPLREMAAALGL
ncbi:MAG: shikimate dehydrogenase [Chthoniobacterales bacterium]